jgi:VWFA-related protein
MIASARVLGAALAAASLTGDARQAQPPPAAQQPPPQQAPTFRAGVDLVAVDVGVVDRNGRPVDDLKPGEFTLRVDGRPREIVSAEFVSFRYPDDGPAPDARPFSSNVGSRPGRLIMIVIDEGNLKRGSVSKIIDAAVSFIDSLGRADRVGLQIIPGAGPLVNFTADHEQVKRLIRTAVGTRVEAERTDRVGIAEAIEILERPFTTTGGAPQGPLADLFERECPGEHDVESLTRCRRMLEGLARVVHANTRSHTTQTLVALREIVERLTGSSDAKTVVLITEGIVVGRQFADVSWVADRTAAASVSFYGLRVDSEVFDAAQARRSPTRKADRDLLVDGLDMVVGLARGTVLPLSLDGAATFARLNLELSGHYLLSFRPEPGDRDGKSHQIDITTRRRDVTLRSRRQFTVDASTRERPVNTRLVDALRSPLLLSDIGLQVTTFVYRDVESGRLKILVSSEIDRANATGSLGIAYYVTDRDGKVIASQLEIETPAPAAGSRAQYFTGSVLVDPGLFNLKFAVVDQQGRSGSVEHVFEAKLTAIGQLRVGELMLAVPPRPGMSLRPAVDGRIASETLVGYTELYSEAEPQLAMVSLALEIASSEAGAPMVTTPMRLATGAVSGKRTAEASLPLALLTPGSYVARAVVSSNGRVVGRVSRPFTLERAAPATSTPVPSFERAFVLSRPAVGFFLDRLAAPGLPPVPEPLAPAVGLARTGRFTQAVDIIGKTAVAHFVVPFIEGLDQLAAGELQAAVERFGESLREAPSFFPAAFYLGACYAAAGRDRDALTAWRSVPLPDPAGLWAPTVMADSLLRVGEPLQPDDQAVLVLAMKAIYDERTAGRALETTDADRQRFLRYFSAYGTGPATSTIAQWKNVVEK